MEQVSNFLFLEKKWSFVLNEAVEAEKNRSDKKRIEEKKKLLNEGKSLSIEL